MSKGISIKEAQLDLLDTSPKFNSYLQLNLSLSSEEFKKLSVMTVSTKNVSEALDSVVGDENALIQSLGLTSKALEKQSSKFSKLYFEEMKNLKDKHPDTMIAFKSGQFNIQEMEAIKSSLTSANEAFIEEIEKIESKKSLSNLDSE